MLFPDTLVLMRGGGDLATGVAWRLARAGFPLVILELPSPLAVRRTVSLAGAVIDGQVEVEGLCARRAKSVAEALSLSPQKIVPVLVDPEGSSIRGIQPAVLVDARLKKSSIETGLNDAPLVVGLGPGFTAGVNCHAAIETHRGHFLGRVYWSGPAEQDTGAPDRIGGQDRRRVLRAPCPGVVKPAVSIGDSVRENQLLATVGEIPIVAPFAGVVRGMIAGGTFAEAGLKLGDIDPRGCRSYCYTISDKSLAVGGGVLDAVLTWLNDGRRPQRVPAYPTVAGEDSDIP